MKTKLDMPKADSCALTDAEAEYIINSLKQVTPTRKWGNVHESIIFKLKIKVAQDAGRNLK